MSLVRRVPRRRRIWRQPLRSWPSRCLMRVRFAVIISSDQQLYAVCSRACENSFYLDAARNRCVSCSVPTTPTKTMAPIVIVSTAAFIITCLSVLLCGRASVFRFVSSAFLSVFKPAPAGKEAYESAIEFARGDGEDQGAANDTKESVADESEARADGTEGCTYSQNYSRDSQRDSLRESSRDAEDGRRDRFWKSVLIKLKIIIAG